MKNDQRLLRQEVIEKDELESLLGKRPALRGKAPAELTTIH